MGSEITDDTVEPLAYAVCNTDGVEGLAWTEVEQCEVSKNKYKDLELESLACVEVKYLEVKKIYLKDTSCFLIKFSPNTNLFNIGRKCDLCRQFSL